MRPSPRVDGIPDTVRRQGGEGMKWPWRKQRCPKCKSFRLKHTYRPVPTYAPSGYEPVNQVESVRKDEHILVTCEMCGYMWTKDCVRQKP